MQFVELKNPRVLNLLEKFRYLYREKYDITKTTVRAHGVEPEPSAEDWISEEYLKKVMSLGKKHIGVPSASLSYCIKPEHYIGSPHDYQLYKEDFRGVNDILKEELGLRCSALSQLYPPKGFIDWHNNANASAFNVVFTWSETGDGRFKWYDMEKKEIITMKDKKGWRCKAGYFASYGDDVPVTYHCAYTNCWRMTHSYTLGFDKNYWLDMIDYIQLED